MEAASENRGRGRPPKFPPEMMKYAEAQGRKTRRGQQDHIYGGLVISDIMRRYPEDERRNWLVNEETAKWSILSELGRLRDQRGEEAFWEAVEWVLENRPKVKEAVAVLRRYRTGRSPQGNADGVYEALRKTTNDYLKTHPGTPTDAVETALVALLGTVRETRT
jgi:hypothetical protein